MDAHAAPAAPSAPRRRARAWTFETCMGVLFRLLGPLCVTAALALAAEAVHAWHTAVWPRASQAGAAHAAAHALAVAVLATGGLTSYARAARADAGGVPRGFRCEMRQASVLHERWCTLVRWVSCAPDLPFRVALRPPPRALASQQLTQWRRAPQQQITKTSA